MITWSINGSKSVSQLFALSGDKPMTSNQLPAVLTFNPPQSGIAVYRALKQARELIEGIEPENDSHADILNATLDDLALMMQAVE